MSTYLNFDATKNFRNFILSKNLSTPNGPQSFTENNYSVNNLNNYSNIEQGGVTVEQENSLNRTKNTNVFKPIDFLVIESFNTLPRKSNLNLYPYFNSTRDRTLVGVMSSSNYDDESELFKFTSSYIKNDPNGPVLSRIRQNLYTATAGRVRILDALQGNTSTAINLITGKEPLIEFNNKITVSKTLPGKAIDFLQTVAGVEFPWVEIPGDYLSNPRNPVNYRPTSNIELGSFIQDITGSIGSLIGIQRRPKIERKPSDLFIEYMGEGQKQYLYDNLSYLTYGPNYTTVARSQNSSKIFNFVDKIGSGVKNLLGLEAPNKTAYIGDDRGNDVKYAMNDFNDRPVRSNYYLSLLFDPIQTELLKRDRNYTEGGQLSGNLTWVSSNSKNKNTDSPEFQQSLSTNFGFRKDSILGYTQEILNSLPTNGKEMRSHVGNVIDQTSRVFKEGEIMMSRGSAIKYVNKFTGEESGAEYCRVWTKDRGYVNNSNLQKKNKNIRENENSVLTTPYNLNIYPNSNGNGMFDNTSSNIKEGVNGFYAKKYMFSIENLAWKTSNIPGFTYTDLPYCERGNNGGRVMWFPPYDLKVSEQNNADWESNIFLGRPEPIYTYKNAARNGSISFKVIVDHPSVLNLLVNKHFDEKMSDEESDNYINAFFSGCEDVNLYDLIRKYPTLTQTELETVLSYLNGGTDPTIIEKYRTEFLPVKDSFLPEETSNNITNNTPKEFKITELFFDNAQPKNTNNPYISNENYDVLVKSYLKSKEEYKNVLNIGIDKVFSYPSNSKSRNNDLNLLEGSTINDILTTKNLIEQKIDEKFEKLSTQFSYLENSLDTLKDLLNKDKIENIRIIAQSFSSSPDNEKENLHLSYRRTYSVLSYVLEKLSLENKRWKLSWGSTITDFNKPNIEKLDPIPFEHLGYPNKGEIIFSLIRNDGEFLKDNKVFFTQELNKTAPIMFENRKTDIIIAYTPKNETVEKTLTEENVNSSEFPSVNIIVDKVEVKRKPPQDEIKKIILKSLSECYYFKKLEEDSPIVFKSLKDKFKYFHPGFHSMTPEGLNARLTFLNQCVRPGDTIPIKGVNSSLDLRARNTSFGPPPICVLRVGDFYHSKVIVRDVNINFEESPWDLNPEGIGIQPMIASVQMQISFIGGQGLEKPVNWLQNALTSNFYANTEMYDPRSITTNETIGGRRYEEFTKEFINSLMDDTTKKPTYVEPNTSDKISTGQYIGELVNNSLNYRTAVEGVFSSTNKYVSGYGDLYNKIVPIYGKNVSSILLSPVYRNNNNYNVYSVTDGSPTPINLFGLYEKGRDLFVLTSMFEKNLNNTLSTIDVLEMFKFDKEIPTNKIPVATKLVKDYLALFITEKIDDMNSDTNLQSIEKSRTDLIQSLDKVNFIVKYGYDVKLNENKNEANKGILSGFTYDQLYNDYSSCIEYITKNSDQFYEDLDISINYSNAIDSLSDEQFSNIMSDLLSTVSSTEFISKTFGKDTILFDVKLTEKLSKRYENFVNKTDVKKFKFSKFKERARDIDLIYDVTMPEPVITDSNIIDEIIKMNKTPNIPINELNYYRV